MMIISSPRLRKFLRIALPAVLIPGAVIGGSTLVDAGNFVLLILLVTVLSLLLFIAGVERRQIGTRRMVAVAVLVALSVAGRFIPLFKPISALTIIGALYLGGEAGFLIGALSALLSNFYFGQGPWTPFQMLAWGLIGLLAGIIRRPMKKSRLLLLSYGLLSGVAYSMLMDIWTVMWGSGTLDPAAYLAAILTALPHTVLYAVSNLVFLALFARPLGEKLERVRAKYGI